MRIDKRIKLLIAASKAHFVGIVAAVMCVALTGCYYDIDNQGYPRTVKVSADGGEMTIRGDISYTFRIYNTEGDCSYPFEQAIYPDWYDPCDPLAPELQPEDVVYVYDNSLDWLEVLSCDPLVIRFAPNDEGKKRKLYLDGLDDWTFGAVPSITVIQPAR